MASIQTVLISGRNPRYGRQQPQGDNDTSIQPQSERDKTFAGNGDSRQEPVVRFQCGQRHDRKIRFPDRFIKNRTGVPTNPRNNYTYFQSYQLMFHAPIVAFDERRMDSILKQEKEGRLTFRRPSIDIGRQRRPLSRFWRLSDRLF